MNAVTFDTLKFTRRLKAGGFTAEQAEATTDGLVTKSHLDSKLAELELRLTVRMGGMIAVATAVLLAFDKFL